MDEVKVEPMELEDPLANNMEAFDFNCYFSAEPPVVAVLDEMGASASEFKVQHEQEQIPSSSSKTLPPPPPVEVKKVETDKKGKSPKSRFNIVPKIFLGDIMSIPSTERKCCVCYQTDKRSVIPQTARIHFWLAEKIWIPANNRCCGHHLEEESGRKIFTKDAVRTLRERRRMGVSLTGHEAGKWIHWLTDQINDRERWWRQFAKESGF